MNENDVKPFLDRLKKDPSMDDILNFTQAMLKKLPESNNADTDSTNTGASTNMNKESLNSLMKAAKNIVNPATLSYLSRTLNQTENKEDHSGNANLKLEVTQLSVEVIELKEQLTQTKAELAEKSQWLEILRKEVEYLKRRKKK